MIVVPPASSCDSCALLKWVPDPEYDRDAENDPLSIGFLYLCAAFPDGIPWDIRFGGFDHRSPYPADRGVRHDLKPGMEDLLSAFEQEIPEEVRSRDVRSSSAEWMREVMKLKSRQLRLVEEMMEAPALSVPVRGDGAPVVWNHKDFSMLGVGCEGPIELEFNEHDDFQGWRPSTLEELAASVSEDVLLYVDKRGPLLRAGALRNFNFSLFRAVRDGAMEQWREEFSRSLVYRPGKERVVFTSLLALEAARGMDVSWEAVRGGEVLMSGPVVLDQGQPHEVTVTP